MITGKLAVKFQDDFSYDILNPEEIVQSMVDCIKEVNQVLQIPATTTRILLNHFRWDKEKLMERYLNNSLGSGHINGYDLLCFVFGPPSLNS